MQLLRGKRHAFNFTGAYSRTITPYFDNSISTPRGRQHLCGPATLVSTDLGSYRHYSHFSAEQNR